MALGDTELTTGSMYQWITTLTKNSAVWDISALTVTFWWKRPNGTKFSKVADTATSLGVATYTDVLPQLDTQGPWHFSVFVENFGYILSREFTVRNSP